MMNKIIVSFTLLFLLTACLTSCTTLRYRNIPVTYSDRETLAFTGKGAGAGIMLDSLLGGTGVAIGIAIDEGIAKQIRENIEQSDSSYNYAKELKKRVDRKSLKGLEAIVIDRYGFRTAKGEGDMVTAWLVVNVSCKKSTIKITYPDDFSDPASASLSQIKTDADAAILLLSKASEQLLTKNVCS
jgi:hypothetical protein